MVTDSAEISKGLNFGDRVRERASQIRSWLCVGLDPALDKLPAGLPRDPSGQVDFCRRIIEATERSAVAFKVNFGFFEAGGPEGWHALAAVREAIPGGLPVIADAKRGDIASTGESYAAAILDVLGFDAVTVNPYLGWDAVLPFVTRSGKAAFVLCRTSNQGARDFQDLETDGTPLYLRIAQEGTALETEGEIGLVVGGTYPGSLRAVRALSEEVMLLVPGIGAQGADARACVESGSNAAGHNALAAVSREIIFASSGDDFADAAGRAANRLAEETWLGDRAG
jgi:orotidine-5'-phosphate decarboxylase